MAKFFRAMKIDDDRKPSVGRSAVKLGVRVESPGNASDILVTNGMVSFGIEGMSVSPSPSALPPHRIPRRLRDRFPEAHGADSTWVWKYGDGDFLACQINESIAFRPTSVHHGVLCPTVEMPLLAYEEGLATTRNEWELAD
jgi:hypothetical protein